MGLLSLEQDRTLVRVDFAVYGLLVTGLAMAMLAATPHSEALAAAGWLLAGLCFWTLVEYALHRFVLHGLPPFSRWHGMHHAQPRALIATPTVLTLVLFAAFVFAPAWWLAPSWRGLASTLGVMLGYLFYIWTHDVVHQVPARAAWLSRQRRWHAVHHRAGSHACYGVSLRLWDHVFGSADPRGRA